MGIVKGAAALLDATKSTGSSGSRINFFKLEDGESIFVRFLQELDYDSETFAEEAGVGLIAIEHNAPGPQGWKRKALCTSDEGECWACEQYASSDKNEWRPKSRLYINLLAEKDGEEVVQVWNAPRSVAAYLLEFSSEEGAITNRRFKVTRTGRGTDTKYLLMGKSVDSEAYDVTQHELVDVEERLLKVIDYDKQEAFYLGDEDGGSEGSGESIPWN